LARDGADIVIQDLCGPIESVAYPLGTREELAETARLVEAEGRRVIAEQGDVRDRAAMDALVEKARDRFGRLDILIPNAGIMPALTKGDAEQGYFDCIDVMLNGVWNTMRAALPLIREGGRGGSIVLVSSAAALRSITTTNVAGSLGYMSAKAGLIGLMRGYANILAAESIRVNTIHPTGLNSPMIVNEAFAAFVDEHPEVAGVIQNAMPVQMIEAQDTTNAIRWLVSDDARYVTGITLPIDAGFVVRA
jgi:NAD(P)-dependent dehydrogenase (short-subunit alcohol dehydrogenase family)